MQSRCQLPAGRQRHFATPLEAADFGSAIVFPKPRRLWSALITKYGRHHRPMGAGVDSAQSLIDGLFIERNIAVPLALFTQSSFHQPDQC